MKPFLKRFVYILGTGSVVVASCKVDYGMPADVDYFKTVEVKTEQNEPIPGLSVSLLDYNDTIFMNKTDNLGILTMEYEFYKYYEYSVLIEDTDGEENLGAFAAKTIKLSQADTTKVIMNSIK
jgi:hypothetical protein